MGAVPTLVRAQSILHEGLQRATGMIVSAGKVAAIGDAEQLAREWPEASLDDYGTATITPGLIDGHAHPVWGVAFARGADFSACNTLAEFTAVLAEAEAQLSEGEWLIGYGLAPHVFAGAPVTNDPIHERIGVDRPVYITLFDAHSALVSRATLVLAEIDSPEAFSDGAAIVEREDATKADGVDRLSGHLLEFTAMERVLPHVPLPPVTEQADALAAVLEGMSRTGLTGVYVPDAQARDLVAVLTELEARGELPVRLRISPWCTPFMTPDEITQLAQELGQGGRRWQFEGVKLFIDGTIDGGTAWLEQPDTRGEGLRGFWHDPAQYARNLQQLNDLGVPTITHAIGDRGVRFVAETLAALPDRGLQHRIDHLEIVADEVVDLIGANEIAVCIQPSHCSLFVHPDGSDLWSIRLGEPRNQQGWRTRRFLESGVVEALGSDWPVAHYDPRQVIADAQLRHPHDRDTPPIQPEQALTAAEALLGYTELVPRSVGLPGGALAVGDDADYTVWAANPLDLTPQEVAQVPILATAIGGALVFTTEPELEGRS